MISDSHIIRRAELRDAETLSRLAAVTFYEAYADICARENMDAYIAQKYTAERMAEEIADPHIDTWLAWATEEAVGFLQLVDGVAPQEVRGRKPLKLDRLYLRRAMWGGGLGQRFMELSLRTAQERGHDSLWLSVWEKNPRALRFYERWNFVDIGWEIFPTGEERSIDRLMERALSV